MLRFILSIKNKECSNQKEKKKKEKNKECYRVLFMWHIHWLRRSYGSPKRANSSKIKMRLGIKQPSNIFPCRPTLSGPLTLTGVFLGSFQTHVPLMKLGGLFSFLLFGIVLFLFAFIFIFMETDFLLLFIYFLLKFCF